MADISHQRNQIPRREMPRHVASVQATCQLNGAGNSFTGTIVNISITGAMIMGCQPIAPNSVIRIKIPEIGELSAKVVWNNGEALGLSFDGLSMGAVENSLAHTVNGLPEQNDRRNVNQYAQPATH